MGIWTSGGASTGELEVEVDSGVCTVQGELTGFFYLSSGV